MVDTLDIKDEAGSCFYPTDILHGFEIDPKNSACKNVLPIIGLSTITKSIDFNFGNCLYILQRNNLIHGQTHEYFWHGFIENTDPLIPRQVIPSYSVIDYHSELAALHNNREQGIFLNKLIELDKSNQIEGLKFLYDKVDFLLDSKEYKNVDSLIDNFLLLSFSLQLHIGFLTISNRQKNKLTKRPALFDKAYHLFKDKYSTDKADKLLAGFK